MDFWPEFLANSWGREFVGGGFGGIAGIFAGYPLDTIRIRLQHSSNGSAFSILRHVVSKEGPLALYRGMGAPLASVTFQNAMVFQIYATLSKVYDKKTQPSGPPSYIGVAIGGVGTGAIQTLILTPIELIKIRLQLQRTTIQDSTKSSKLNYTGPLHVAKGILKTEGGLRGIYRGLTVTVLRDAPAHGFYFCTYEYIREQLHPGCRKNGHESFKTMLISGGLAGVASWLSCYPLDVIKTRLQAQSQPSIKYLGIVDCFRKSVERDGYNVLWRGLGTALIRAFIVNGAVFTAYETSLRCLFPNGNPM